MSVVKSDNTIFFSLSSQELTGGFAPTVQPVSWARSGHMTACL